MPRTTIDIDASVLARIKRVAQRSGKSLGAVVSELLAGALSKGAPKTSGLKWHTQPMRARVDLDDKEAVQRALDEP